MVGSLGAEIRSGIIAYPLDDLALRVSLFDLNGVFDEDVREGENR